MICTNSGSPCIPLTVKSSVEAMYFPAKLSTLSAAEDMFITTFISEQQNLREPKRKERIYFANTWYSPK